MPKYIHTPEIQLHKKLFPEKYTFKIKERNHNRKASSYRTLLRDAAVFAGGNLEHYHRRTYKNEFLKHSDRLKLLPLGK